MYFTKMDLDNFLSKIDFNKFLVAERREVDAIKKSMTNQLSEIIKNHVDRVKSEKFGYEEFLQLQRDNMRLDTDNRQLIADKHHLEAYVETLKNMAMNGDQMFQRTSKAPKAPHIPTIKRKVQ